MRRALVLLLLLATAFATGVYIQNRDLVVVGGKGSFELGVVANSLEALAGNPRIDLNSDTNTVTVHGDLSVVLIKDGAGNPRIELNTDLNSVIIYVG